MRFVDPLPDPLAPFIKFTEREESLDNLVDVHPFEPKDEEIWEAKGSVPLICFGAVRVAGVKYRPVRGRASSFIEELHPAPPPPGEDDVEGEAVNGGIPPAPAANPEGAVDTDSDSEGEGPALVGVPAAEGSAVPGQDQSSTSPVLVREDGHAHGCGHELHVKTWDIYERVVLDS